MQTERRTLLASLVALLATPLLLGRGTAARALAPRLKAADPEPLPPPRITPPAHSVKRRG